MRLVIHRRARGLTAALCLLLLVLGLASAAASGCRSTDDASSSTGTGSSTSTQGGTAGAYAQSGRAVAEEGQTYSATGDDQSAIVVSDTGLLTLANALVETSGDTSSEEASGSHGLNAAVVAAAGSEITMFGGSITTTGSGASGAFATGKGAAISLTGVAIETADTGAGGVVATQGAMLTLDNVKITTAGVGSAPLAAGPGGGTIIASGGAFRATGAEAVAIESSGGIALTDTDVSTAAAGTCGVMLRRRVPGEPQGAGLEFSMVRGSFNVAGERSPLFYVADATAYITIDDVEIACESGVLVAAAGTRETGGSRGGTAVLTAIGQAMRGDLIADSYSTIRLRLTGGSVFTGAINAGNTAKRADLTLDANSVFIVTADTYLTGLTLTGGVAGPAIASIVGNGHTVYYDAGNLTNSALGGQTYALSGGGRLRPLGKD